MNDVDRLKSLARALRENHTGLHPDPSRSRRAILAEVSTRPRRKLRLAWVGPIAAVLGVSSAWAAAQPLQRFAWIRSIERVFGSFHSAEIADVPVEKTSRPTVNAALPVNATSAVTSAPEEAPSSFTPSPAAPIVPRARPAATVSARPAVVASTTTEPARAEHRPTAAEPSAQKVTPALPIDEGDALYEAAHVAHFVQKNPQRALDAWGAYLAKRPSGPFAPEANYNRALCLVRLGRLDEARAALRPFAQGRYGNYRRDDASSLLDALDRASAPGTR
jgi:hypothetical protein